MTIEFLYSSQRPKALYNVLNGRKELPATASFTRASGATYVDSDGIVKKVLANEPRFNYKGTNRVFEGLLLEEEQTNYIPTESVGFVYGVTDGSYTTRGIPMWRVMRNTLPQPDDVYISGGVTPGSSGKWTFSEFIDLSKTDDVGLILQGVVVPGPGVLQIIWEVNVSDNTIRLNQWYPNSSGAWTDGEYYVEDWGGGLWRTVFTATSQFDGSERCSLYITGATDTKAICRGGWQLERSKEVTSLILGATEKNTRNADELSFFTAENYDNGFSLLLDSETTTDDKVYEIKDGGAVKASLKNNAGTLDWNVNGKSAAINGDYPQVGFTPGRSRTISSFGPANSGDQTNYLYTTGLSFPTVAEPAAGVDELVLGLPQKLKALYIWDGQLHPLNAVSLIKGQYNLVTPGAVDPDAYAFVANTDPTNDRDVNIELSGLIPKVSQTVDWGDGTSSTLAKGISPSHDYPYFGEYRIQVKASGTPGWDQIGLGTTTDMIKRVEAWPPEYRSGASGNGFVGADMTYILNKQYTNKTIPDFKYTNLTDLTYAFANNQYVPPDGGLTTNGGDWSWIPTDLSFATTLRYTFFAVSAYYVGDSAQSTFPQLTTSDKLTNVEGCFNAMRLKKFPTNGLPFTNTSKVTNWEGCFAGNGELTEIGTLDFSSATTIRSIVSNCVKLAVIPGNWLIQDVPEWTQAFDGCTGLTAFPQLAATNVKTLTYTWRACTGLTSFPQLTITNAETLTGAWYGCTNMTSFPNINMPAVTSLSYAWFNCYAFTSFPNLNMPENGSIYQAWYSCVGLSSFPALNMPKVTDAYMAWYYCYNLKTFPAVNMPNVTRISGAWRECLNLESMPNLNLTKVTDASVAWYKSSQLKEFPPGFFDTTGTLVDYAFSSTWYGCALPAAQLVNILDSLVTNGTSNISLGIAAGTNAPRYQGSSGTTGTAGWPETQFTTLISRGWTINYNKYTGVEDTLPVTFYVAHGPDAIHIVETTGEVETGQPHLETFTEEIEWVSRIMQLDRTIFPKWDRGEAYLPGDRVRFGNRVFRALEKTDTREFELPTLAMAARTEVPTPRNRKRYWLEVFDPKEDDEAEE